MGLLEFLDHVINSDKVYSYSQFIHDFNKVAHSEKIVEEKIDPKIIALCRDALNLVNEKVARFGELRKHLNLFIGTKGKYGTAKHIINKQVRWFNELTRLYTEEETVLKKEKRINHFLFELEKSDYDIVMQLLHKIKRLENFDFGVDFHKSIGNKPLFDALTEEVGFDKDLSSGLERLNTLLKAEDDYLVYFNSHDLSSLYKGAAVYSANLDEQKSILEKIFLQENKKRFLVSGILRFVRDEVAKLGVGEVALYLPVIGITDKMRHEFDALVKKERVSELYVNQVNGSLNRRENDFLRVVIEKNFEPFICNLMHGAKKTPRLLLRTFACNVGLLTSNNLDDNDLHHLIAYCAFLKYPRNRSNGLRWQSLVNESPTFSKADYFEINYLIVAYRMSSTAGYDNVVHAMEKALASQLSV